jgi:hypothetical protein
VDVELPDADADVVDLTGSVEVVPAPLADSATTSTPARRDAPAAASLPPRKPALDWEVQFQWDLLRYFPDSLRKQFAVLLGRYLLFCMDWVKGSEHVDPDAFRDTDEAEEDFAAKIGNLGGEGEEAAVLQKILRNAAATEDEDKRKTKMFELYVKQDVQALLDGIVRNYEKSQPFVREDGLAGEADAASPAFALPSKWSTPPIVSFVVAVCHLLALDPLVRPTVTIVRNNILQRLRVSGFSASAAFVNPCASVVLTSFPCSYCGVSRDLDLGRDQRLVLHNWSCPVCGHPYDAGEVENLLVELVDKKMAAFYSQDLRCPRCRLVQSNYFGQTCKCTGRFVLTLNRAELVETITVLNHLAQFHGMEQLLETTQDLISLF